MSPEVRADLTLDASQAESTIEQLGASLDALFGGTQSIDIPVTIDTSAAEAEIAALSDVQPVDIPVSADTGEAVAAIDALPSDVAPVDVPVTADTSEAEANIAGLGDTIDATTGKTGGLKSGTEGLDTAFSVTGGSADILTGSMGGVGEAASSAGPEIAGAAGAAVGLGGAFSVLFDKAINAEAAQQRFNITTGAQAAIVNTVDIPGLSGKYTTLSEKLGIANTELQDTESTIFNHATAFGAAAPAATDYTRKLTDLALNAKALNPNLGDLASITQRLERGLPTGSKQLQLYGVSLSKDEVNARLMKDTLDGTNASLDEQGRVRLAAVEAAWDKFSGSMQGNIDKAIINPGIQLKATTVAFEDQVAKLAKPLIVPMFDLLRSSIPLMKDWVKIAADMAPAVSAAAKVMDGFAKVFELQTTAMTAAGNAIGGFIKGLGGVVSAVGGFASSVASGFSSALSAVSNFAGSVGSFFSGIGSSIASGVSAAIGWVNNLKNAIAGIVGKAVSIAVNGVEAAVSGVQSVISTIANFVGKTVDIAVSGAENAISLVSSLIGTIASLVGKTVSIAVDGVTSAIKDVSDLVSEIAKVVSKSISITVDIATSGPQDLVDKLLHPFGAAGGHIGHAMAGADIPGSGVGVPMLIGELGPELFVPDVPGTIVPNNQLGSVLNNLANAEPSVVKIHEQPQIHILVVRDWADAQAQIPGLERADPSFVMGRS